VVGYATDSPVQLTIVENTLVRWSRKDMMLARGGHTVYVARDSRSCGRDSHLCEVMAVIGL
jgi:hypothetical protein